jgi:hypothetical protein
LHGKHKGFGQNLSPKGGREGQHTEAGSWKSLPSSVPVKPKLGKSEQVASTEESIKPGSESGQETHELFPCRAQKLLARVHAPLQQFHT